MKIRISQIHSAKDSKALNTEWFVLENTGDKPFSTRNCVVSVAHGNKKKTDLVKLDPGFVLAPGASMRVLTGNPGRKAHGKPPTDDIPNYNLFLNSPALRGPGTVVAFSLRSLTLASAKFDPGAKDGLAATLP